MNKSFKLESSSLDLIGDDADMLVMEMITPGTRLRPVSAQYLI